MNALEVITEITTYTAGRDTQCIKFQTNWKREGFIFIEITSKGELDYTSSKNLAIRKIHHNTREYFTTVSKSIWRWLCGGLYRQEIERPFVIRELIGLPSYILMGAAHLQWPKHD